MLESPTPQTVIQITTPSIDGKYTDNYLHALLRTQRDLLTQHNIKTFVGHSLITEARTTLMRSFLQTDATHLLFVDADIGFGTADLVSMIEADKPIIGGVCVQKRYNWEAIRQAALNGAPAEKLAAAGGVFTFNTGPEPLDIDVTKREPLRVKSVGFGFTLIKREVIQTMATRGTPKVKFGGGKPFPALCAQAIDMDTQEWMSEDYSFCYKANQCGYDTYLAWWTRTSHAGYHVWEGDLLSSAQYANGAVVEQNCVE